MAAQHVTFKNGSWRVIGAGNSKAKKNFDTQKKQLISEDQLQRIKMLN